MHEYKMFGVIKKLCHRGHCLDSQGLPTDEKQLVILLD